MSKVDRIKEKIGWYKVLFGVLVASLFSLIAWLISNLQTAATWQLVCTMIACIGSGVVAAAIHLNAQKQIDLLEDL
ncbi:MAG: hypothetical protein QM533_09405 [Cytophagales bacterium]|nr:hypothetical protein [Cytophagales bacterium]